MSERRYKDFDGIVGGVVYDVVSGLTGFGRGFYQTAVRALPLKPGMCVVDLGCGTANLGIAAAERIGPGGRIIGVDLSEKQLARAREKAAYLPVPFQFELRSMDSLPMEDGSVDAVISSLAVHAAPPEIRRSAIREVGRVLRPGGFFGLIEWSRPRLGLTALIWLPTLLPTPRNRDNWNNAYPGICAGHGLDLETDVRLNSLVRCQVFRRATVTARG